ncbi:hypothetical protein BG015_010877 [Linnemannia schmuckeri]|uniref:Uncharacterized protein n=1 Tax=Linnemannia schmuckeri TaxID=64567 RepID=A0A9P5V8A5_9FUNG|nr:hypothetical protein BG015_010877 [Linnemannia schmuckeri]
MSNSINLPSIQTKFPPYSQQQHQQQQQPTPISSLANSFSALSSSSPRQYNRTSISSPTNSPLLANTNMATLQNNNNRGRGSFSSSSTPSLSSRLSNSSLHSQYSSSSDRSLSCSPGPSTPSDLSSRSPSVSYERLQNNNSKQHKPNPLALPASFSPLQQHQQMHRYSSNGIHPFQQSPSSQSTVQQQYHHHSYHGSSSIPHPATVSSRQQPPVASTNNAQPQQQQQYQGQTPRDSIYPSSSPSSPSPMSSSRDQEYYHHRRPTTATEHYYHAAAASGTSGHHHHHHHRASPVSSPYGSTTPSSNGCAGDYFSRPPTSPSSYHPLATPTTPSTAVVVESSHGRGGPMTPTLPSISTLVAGAAAAAAIPSPLTPMTPRPHHHLSHFHHRSSSPAPSTTGSTRQGMSMRMMLDDDCSSPNMSRSPSISSDRSSVASASVFSSESSPYLSHIHHHHRRPDTPESSSSPTTASTPLAGSAPTPAPASSSSQLLLCPVCSRAFKPSKNQNCNLRRHLKNVHNMSPTMHPRKCKWDSLPDGRVKDDKDRKERTRKSKRLWARKFRLRRKVEEAAVVLSMLSQAL